MKTKIKFLLLLFALMTCWQGYTQNIYANREWAESTPVTGPGIYHTSTIVSSGKLVVTGNVLNMNGDTDILTTKYNTNGTVLWSMTYSGNFTGGGDDYGIELKESGNYTWVVGAVKNNTTGYDWILLKYLSSNGTLSASYSFNGAGNGDDIPTSLYVETSGAFVCGGSEASNGFSDYAVVKYPIGPGSGWTKYYDYNNLHDGATSIVSSGTNVVVTGGSASTVGDWDIATLTIHKLAGTMTSSRTNITGATMVEANAMATDSLNNIFITGYAVVSGDKTMQTVKLDSNLALKWIVNQGESGLDFVGNDIGVDNNGNVFVTGYSEQSGGGSKAMTIKYASLDADTLWTQFYGNVVTEDGVKARKMAVEPDGDIYITGTVYGAGPNSFAFLKYDTDGLLQLTRDYQADSLDDDGFDIVVDGDSVYITGFTETITGRTMTSIKYTLKEKDTAIFYHPVSGNAVFVERDLIVRVDTAQIKKDKIDQLEFEFWELDDIFESTMVTLIERAVEDPCGDDHCGITVYRMFKQLKTTDTTTISRLGETIPIPEFWATFIFEFPDGVDITVAADSLNLLFPYIKYTHGIPFVTFSSAADDALYADDQSSLHSTTDFDTAHINVEPAWDLEVGQPFIRVGIYDDGINWQHEDFQTGTVTKVEGGWDFGEDASLFADSGWGFHGTPCAGIIGAKRNNGIGIAGIAGGNDSISNSGVSLYGMRIIPFLDPIPNPVTDIFDAIVGGAIDDTAGLYNYGLNVMSNSWALTLDQFSDYFTDTNFTLMNESIHFANRAKVTFVASMGNNYVDGGAIPASLDDNWVLTVGGTGTDGQYMDGAGAFEDNFIASTGWSIDVSAPATTVLTQTTYGDSYGGFSGTSSAVPHVAGTVALLMSYINDSLPNYNNLAPEDCEHILIYSADDANIGLYPGVDSLTGYGRLNAGNALFMVEGGHCYLSHFGTDVNTNSKSKTLIGTDDTISIAERYKNEAGDWFLPGQYRVDTYRINAFVSHSSGLVTDTIRAAWERHSSSNILPAVNGNDELIPRERITLVTYDDNSADLRGYVYKVSDMAGNPLGWWPFDTTLTNSELTYSILRCDTAINIASVDEAEINPLVGVYPNPSADNQTIVINSPGGLKLNILMYDASGRIINNIYNGTTNDSQTVIPVSLGNLPKGVYFYEIVVGDKIEKVKIIKQ